jgi:hypothetical protein
MERENELSDERREETVIEGEEKRQMEWQKRRQ